MIRTFLRRLLTGSVLALLLSLQAAPVAYSQALDPICERTPQASICQENQPQTPTNNRIYGRNGILTKVAHILSLVVGFISIFVLIIGGVRFVSATGDINKINSARDSILFAVVGLALAALAQSVIIFILNKL